MKTVIADCETDGFLHEMTRLWCIQIGDADGDDAVVYADQPGYPSIKEGIERLKSADRIVMHNGTKFDLHAINRFYPDTVTLENLYDTLVVARLLDPEERFHNLDDWGKRLGVHKGSFDDFSRWSEEMAIYGAQDVHVTRALYRKLAPQVEDWGMSVDIEHRAAYVVGLQEHNGFQLNIPAAQALQAELRQELADIEDELKRVFPPRWVPRRVNKSVIHTPTRGQPTGKGLYVAGCPFSRVAYQEFSASSRQQIGDRFKKKYGWRPRKFTSRGAPVVDEKVLSALPYPEAELLRRYLRVTKQLGQLDGDNGWLKLVRDTSRVHGGVNSNGCVTGRMSHFKPNVGQVDKKDLRMREVWVAKEGWKLVGCDADAIETVMLSHYLARIDGGAFATRVMTGDKSKGTDIHTVNKKALGLNSRESPGAKSFLYALMYGAGDAKLGSIIIDDARLAGKPKPKGSPKTIGSVARKKLDRGMTGVNQLIEGVKAKARKRKWLKGLDGRKIWVRSPHSALNTLLQGGGAIVMKLALVLFHFELAPAHGWEHGVNYAYCANVHDEVQIEAIPEIADDVGKAFASAIVLAGERLELRCKTAGTHSVGNNWKETH